jgi:fido (protein-threonine AMPylation protein)
MTKDDARISLTADIHDLLFDVDINYEMSSGGQVYSHIQDLDEVVDKILEQVDSYIQATETDSDKIVRELKEMINAH